MKRYFSHLSEGFQGRYISTAKKGSKLSGPAALWRFCKNKHLIKCSLLRAMPAEQGLFISIYCNKSQRTWLFGV
jgi:hypothetical protein